MKNFIKERKTTIILGIIASLLVLLVLSSAVLSPQPSEELVTPPTTEDTSTKDETENIHTEEPSVEVEVPEIEEPEISVEGPKKLEELVQISKDPFVKPLEEMLDRPITPENTQGGFRAYPFISDKGFAYQVISMEPKKLVVEIGNTGNSPITINTSNLSFAVYDFSGNNISGSKIDGGSVIINPGEVKRITLTATHESSLNVDVTINGAPLQIQCASELGEDFTDARPFDGEGRFYLDTSYPVIDFANRIAANDTFKVVSNGVTLLKDTEFQGLPKLSEDGSYALVHIKFANISDKTIEFEDFRGANFNSSNDDVQTYSVGSETLDYLGEYALPTVIPPNSIVEGYIPIVMVGNRYNSNIAIPFDEEATDGFIIDNIESLKINN